MKTALILITIITSLFFSACANNNRTEDWNARRAANASFQEPVWQRLDTGGFDAVRRNTFEINY